MRGKDGRPHMDTTTPPPPPPPPQQRHHHNTHVLDPTPEGQMSTKVGQFGGPSAMPVCVINTHMPLSLFPSRRQQQQLLAPKGGVSTPLQGWLRTSSWLQLGGLDWPTKRGLARCRKKGGSRTTWALCPSPDGRPTRPIDPIHSTHLQQQQQQQQFALPGSPAGGGGRGR